MAISGRGMLLQRSVLLVDDEKSILDLMASLIEHTGFAVICATSGDEALLRLQERSFAGMITDLHMPGMNGFELIVRARTIAPDLAIALCTGDDYFAVQDKAAAWGITKILQKPACFAAILDMLVQGTWP